MTKEIVVCRAGYCNDDDEDPKCCAVCDCRPDCGDPCNHAEEGICNNQVITDNRSYRPDHAELADECNRIKGTVCSNCGDPVDEEESYHDDDGDILCETCYDEIYAECHHCGSSCQKNDMREVDGGYVCNHCYDEHYTECELCNATINFDDSFNMKRNGGEEVTVCEGCWDDRSRKCNKCEEYWDRDDIKGTEEGNDYCPDCFEEMASDCSNCGDTHERDEMESIDDELYCKSCAEERTTTRCERCGERVSNDNITIVHGENVCDDCITPEDGEETTQ